MNKKFMILSIAVALLVVATITISSYAYFTISNKEGEESVITSGTMSLLFTDGNEITANNLLPGQSVEKEFTVKNTGNLDTIYDVYLSDVINNFVDRTDLVYELTSTDGGYNTTSQIEVPNRSIKIVNEQSISVDDTHHYKLKIIFLNKDENQDDNQGKVFSAKIQINEYKDIEINTKYYLDNELVNEMPNNNYNYLNSTCDKDAEVLFDDVNWEYDFVNVTQNNTTCNLYFEIPEYTITFDLNYDGATNTTLSKKMGSQYGELPTPSKSGMRFLGWFTDPINGTQISSSTIVTSDNTVYAHWGYNLISDYVAELKTSNTSIVEDNTDEHNLRFIGNNPNNYVLFNNDLWRIIGVFGDNIKIIRDTSVEKRVWNTSRSSNWDTSELKEWLNNTYYNSLSQSAKNMISTHEWRYLADYSQANDRTAKGHYDFEKRGTSSSYNISLIYPSDYAFAGDEICWTNTTWWYPDSNDCGTKNWLNNNTYYWTMIGTSANGNGRVLGVYNNGRVQNPYSDSTSFGVRPTLYLKSNVMVEISNTSNGTAEYPYKLSI